MRYLFIFVLIFSFNFTFAFGDAQKDATTTIEVDVRALAPQESAAKKKAFEEALRTSSQKVLLKHVKEDQKHLIENILVKEDLRKFFKKVDVITFEVSDSDNQKEFVGTFRFHFQISDVKRWLEDNNLTFIEEMLVSYKIVQVPLFVEQSKVFHWFDSSISEALLFNAKNINNFEISLVEPSLKVVSLELLNRFAMHKFAKLAQEQLGYDGYNLVICQVNQTPETKLVCENHLIYEDKRFMENIELRAEDLNNGMQLASEINSIFLSHFSTKKQSVDPQEEEKLNNNGNVILELRYGKLSSLLTFQKLLTQNPYVIYYKVGESKLGQAKFSIQLRGSISTFSKWLESNGVNVISISDETHVLVVQFE